MKTLRRSLLVLVSLTVVIGNYTGTVGALSAQERTLLHANAPWWLQSKLPCSAAANGDPLDGYKLPAIKGYTAKESPIDANGIATELGTPVTFPKHAKDNTFGDGGEVFRDYSINMRWTYAKWYWNGDADSVDPSQFAWLNAKPRLVKVSNPRTHKSVITAVLEAGPAPWTGTYDTEKNNEAKFGWQQPQLGTPPDSSGWKGRVSGLTPKAMAAIEAKPGVNNGETGDVLLYEWATDQNAKPGTMGESSTPAGTTSDASASCGSQVNADGYAMPIKLSKDVVDNGWNKTTLGWPCATYCHHDTTGAFDLAHTNTVKKGDDNASIGVPVVAIYNGKVSKRGNYAGESGCFQIQFVAADGWHYWYGHLRGAENTQVGQQFNAGDRMAEIGERKCTGNSSYPHLHIDRGSPQGRDGGGEKLPDGTVCCRDMGFVQLMNSIYASMQ